MSALGPNHQRVQRLRRLVGRRSFRAAEGVFVGEGVKVLSEALDAGAEVEGVYAVAGTAHPVIDQACARGIRVFDLLPGVMEKVSDTVTPQPVISVLRRRGWELGDLRGPLAAGGFVLVGVELQDPGNAGTVIRSAEGAGAVGVVLVRSVEATNPKTVRATAGALFHVRVVETDRAGEDVLGELRSFGAKVWATSSVLGGALPYDEVDLAGPCALVLGNEAQGLAPEVVAAADALITIPMAGRTESLNVAMTAAVLAFEAARVRRA